MLPRHRTHTRTLTTIRLLCLHYSARRLSQTHPPRVRAVRPPRVRAVHRSETFADQYTKPSHSTYESHNPHKPPKLATHNHYINKDKPRGAPSPGAACGGAP
eukprot:462750-Prymnesium_polylepis.1